MKKLLLLLLAITLLFTGCTTAPGVSSTTPASPSVTPEPTPVPARIAIAADCPRADAGAFFAAAKAVLEPAGFEIDLLADCVDFSQAADAQAYSGVLVLHTGKADLGVLASSTIPASAVSLVGDQTVRGISLCSYDPSGEAQEALAQALSYPPHDTPVRLIALLQNGDSEAATAWQAAVDEGKIFPKAVFTRKSAKKDCANWIEKELDSFPEGTVDAIYAEDTELAAVAMHALLTRGRTDMEVFCAGADANTLGWQSSAPDLFPVSVGADLGTTAAAQANALLSQMDGGAAVAQTFGPTVISPS